MRPQASRLRGPSLQVVMSCVIDDDDVTLLNVRLVAVEGIVTAPDDSPTIKDASATMCRTFHALSGCKRTNCDQTPLMNGDQNTYRLGYPKIERNVWSSWQYPECSPRTWFPSSSVVVSTQTGYGRASGGNDVMKNRATLHGQVAVKRGF